MRGEEFRAHMGQCEMKKNSRKTWR